MGPEHAHAGARACECARRGKRALGHARSALRGRSSWCVAVLTLLLLLFLLLHWRSAAGAVWCTQVLVCRSALAMAACMRAPRATYSLSLNSPSLHCRISSRMDSLVRTHAGLADVLADVLAISTSP